MQRMTERQAASHPWKPGGIVYYSPRPGVAFGCVVECDPWQVGSGHRVTHVRGLGPEYQACVGLTPARSPGVYCGALRPAPTEYVDGEWVLAGDAEPAAVIIYTEEPIPETGHVGWCWWALGDMGDAASYEQARAAAEAVVRKRGGL